MARHLLATVTPDKVKAAVVRIMRIIEKGSDKDAVAAFKALFDALGVKPAADPDGSGKPAAYVFVVPASGDIPAPAALEPRTVVNEAGSPEALEPADVREPTDPVNLG